MDADRFRPISVGRVWMLHASIAAVATATETLALAPYWPELAAFAAGNRSEATL